MSGPSGASCTVELLSHYVSLQHQEVLGDEIAGNDLFLRSALKMSLVYSLILLFLVLSQRGNSLIIY